MLSIACLKAKCLMLIELPDIRFDFSLISRKWFCVITWHLINYSHNLTFRKGMKTQTLIADNLHEIFCFQQEIVDDNVFYDGSRFIIKYKPINLLYRSHYFWPFSTIFYHFAYSKVQVAIEIVKVRVIPRFQNCV